MSFDSSTTPYYIINAEKVKDNYQSFSALINSAGRNDIIAYSVKANYNPAVILQLNKLGAYFEVCSNYEYELICGFGVDASRIIVNGLFYSDFSQYAGSLLILDSYAQLLRWESTGCNEEIGIRVNLDEITVDERFKNKKSRFGLRLCSQKVNDLLRRVDTCKITCLHCHLSGNNREPSIYADIIKHLSKLRDVYKLDKVKCFDIGGGFKTDSNGKFWHFSDYVDVVKTTCDEQVKIIFEPGNSLVRNCAEYHTKIIAAKKCEKGCIFIADGSSLHLPKADYLSLGFHVNQIGNKRKYSGKKIYGNTCKESDLLIDIEEGKMLAIGDELVFENVGAYSLNEINSLILGAPRILLQPSDSVLIGNHVFEFVCQYSDCFNKNGNNNYSKLRGYDSKKGFYAFVQDGVVSYIGVAYSQSIKMRLEQHFRKSDSGGLRKKLSKEMIKELEKSAVYICPADDTKHNLLLEEAYLIGLCKPKFNFI